MQRIEGFVRKGEQIVETLIYGESRSQMRRADEEHEAKSTTDLLTGPNRIPQASGKEREELIDRLEQIASTEAFGYESFSDFVRTMRKIVGITHQQMYSNGFPFEPQGDLSEEGYLEFNGYDEPVPSEGMLSAEAVSSIGIVPEKGLDAREFQRALLTLGQDDLRKGFFLTIQMPFSSENIWYIDQLFHLEDQVHLIAKYRKRSNELQLLLSNAMVAGFCKDVVRRLQGIPQDHTFIPGQVIDWQARTVRKRS